VIVKIVRTLIFIQFYLPINNLCHKGRGVVNLTCHSAGHGKILLTDMSDTSKYRIESRSNVTNTESTLTVYNVIEDHSAL